MTTKITDVGVAAATRAKNNQGPKINITTFKIGSSISPPVGNEIDIVDDLVYTGSPAQLQYAIVNDSTVQYVVTLDESVGPFDVGRIGLYTDNGDGTFTLFSITSIDAPTADHKFPTSGTVVGNRLTYNIYLAISKSANIANFTIQLLQLLSIPEVPSELSLPPPSGVAFNTYQVMKHSITRVPAVAYTHKTPASWFMSSERLIPGQGEGVVPIDPTSFDTLATVGTVVGLDYTNQKIIVGEPATNKYILGIRSSQEEITNYGVYVDTVNTYTPMQPLFVDTGVNAGKLTITPNNWPIGYALGPANSPPNAVGYLCWIDFTMGFGGGQAGPPGPQGPQGPPGDSGGPGGGGGFDNAGCCYLQKVGANLVLIPQNGNGLIINDVIQKIPTGGVSLPPSGLNPSTLYYIYVYMNGSTMTLMASTAGHITSTTDGIEIMNTDQTKTLVGMAFTVPGPAWADSSSDGTYGQLYVLSWFNPKLKSSVTTFSGEKRTSSQAAWVELGADIRNYFLIWPNREAYFTTGGYCGATSAGVGPATAMSFDGGPYEANFVGANASAAGGVSNTAPVAVEGVKYGLIEGGPHYGTLMGIVYGTGSGSGRWRFVAFNNSGSFPAPVSLTITVEG
jgi:hypothetical protein